jgi:hypothetical protein
MSFEVFRVALYDALHYFIWTCLTIIYIRKPLSNKHVQSFASS